MAGAESVEIFWGVGISMTDKKSSKRAWRHPLTTPGAWRYVCKKSPEHKNRFIFTELDEITGDVIDVFMSCADFDEFNQR